MDKILGSFIWDEQKELVNIHQHKVDFITAAKAFKDAKRKFILTLSILSERKGFSVSERLKVIS